MSRKLISIGNRLMGDDGAAITIAESLRERLWDMEIETIIGETDFEYCLSRIEDGDHIILVDATCLGLKPGAITVSSLEEVYKLSCGQGSFSQHGFSLVTALKKYYKGVIGIVIGIEGRNFDFSLSLSSEIEEHLEDICLKVEAIIDKTKSI